MTGALPHTPHTSSSLHVAHMHMHMHMCMCMHMYMHMCMCMHMCMHMHMHMCMCMCGRCRRVDLEVAGVECRGATSSSPSWASTTLPNSRDLRRLATSDISRLQLRALELARVLWGSLYALRRRRSASVL